MDGAGVQAGSYVDVAVARHATSSGSLSMSFGAAEVEVVGATPVTDGRGAFVVTPASAHKHVPLADCGTSAPARIGGYAGRQAPSSSLVSNGSAAAGMAIACDRHSRTGGISTRAGTAVATTRVEAVENDWTAAQNGERDEGRSTSRSLHGNALVTVSGTAAAKAQQRSVMGVKQPVHPTSSTPLASSPHLTKMESSSSANDQLSHQRQQPASPESSSSRALLSTAVPVQHLYRIPSAFYAQNVVTSSVVLSAAYNRHGHGNTFTSPTPCRVSAESPASKQARLRADVSRSPSAVDVLEERVRRAAELHASGDVGDEAETVLSWAAESRSDETGRTQAPMPSSLLTVQVVRGYRTLGQTPGQGTEERSPSSGGDVRWVPGSKRRRRPERMVSSASVRLDRRLSHTSSHDGGGGAAVSARGLTSLSVSSSSSMVFASPQSPAIALVPATAPARGISAIRPPVATSPFSSLLTTFGHAPSETAALTAGVTGPLLRTATAQPTQLPAWVRPWLSHALSRTIASRLVRDADAAVADAYSAGTATQSLNFSLSVPLSTSAVATATSASAPPCTLRTALLLIFDGLERLEADLAEVLLSGPSAHHSSRAGHAMRAGDGRATPRGGERTPRALTPSCAAVVAASGASDGLVEQLRRLTRHWCEVLSQWPCEATTLGYVELWLGHPAWTELVTCGATTAPVTLAAFPTTSVVTDPKERVGWRAETSDGAQRLLPQQQPQAPDFALRGALATVVTEGMHALLDALVDVFVRAVSGLLHSTGVVRQPQSLTQSTSYREAEAEVAASAVATEQHTCQELLRLLTSLYVSPPPALQQFLKLVHGDVRSPTAVTSATAKGDARTVTRHEHEGSSASTESLSTATAATAVGGDRQQQPHPSSSPSSSPRSGPPDSSFASGVGLGALNDSQPRSRVYQLHYQLLYAVCRLCNELPMLWQPQEDTLGSEESRESSGVRASCAADHIDLVSRLRDNGECERARLALFAAAARLAATVSALLLHVQLPMKGDLLCVASRLAQWRATLLRSSCMSEREYTVAMGHLCALMMQAT
ncbi:hypothetical protein LSCM4_07961 [Leishmania orientalis]|uniref:Uncharacterized protein n=1 Tax=Leishmania orientalis TaxID=2249476 RepID=A0A836H232_9TRYP|nr:hypothetical protein LSCM4_07961 [Leishmania orientalis]